MSRIRPERGSDGGRVRDSIYEVTKGMSPAPGESRDTVCVVMVVDGRGEAVVSIRTVVARS